MIRWWSKVRDEDCSKSETAGSRAATDWRALEHSVLPKLFWLYRVPGKTGLLGEAPFYNRRYSTHRKGTVKT
eukprot:g5476.t1